MIIPTLGCGGAEILACNLAMEFVKKGHKVKILCNNPLHYTYQMMPNREFLEKHVGVEICDDSVTLRFLRKPIIRNSTLVRLITSFKPDVIHSHLFLGDLYALSSIAQGVSYISHVHDNMYQLKRASLKSFLSKKGLATMWERYWLLYRYAQAKTRFIAISKDVDSYLKENLPHSDIQLIGNAIDLKLYMGAKTSFVDDGLLKIISVGNLVPKKNHILLIQLSILLKNAGVNHRIDIYGHGNLLEFLKSKAHEMQVDDTVFFHGTSGEIPLQLHSADLYIHPAIYEPFGLVLLEAMASGLPIISVDGFGNRELIREGENGFLIPTNGSADLIFKRINWFLEDKKRFAEIAAAGLKFSANYGMETFASKILQRYNKSS